MREPETSRLEKLRQSFIRLDIDMLLVSHLANLCYLSGFTGSAGSLLVSANKALLAVDFRYVEQAENEVSEFEIIQVTGSIADWLPKLASDYQFRRIGFEAEHTVFATYNQICRTAFTNGSQFVPTTKVVESIRSIKEPKELTLIIAAAKIADSAIDYARAIMPLRKTEREMAWEIEKYIRENGGEAIPFDIIVASGPNAAMPHSKPTDRPIQKGEPVIIDVGARVNGYCSDLSRTVFLGAEDKTFSKVYDIVLGAHLASLATITAGMNGAQADSQCRTIIEQAGYDEAFGHGLGHGVGLETHESPRLGPNSADVLADGMVFTVEPGVYISGWGGIRIEDTVVMENGKVRSLTKVDKRASIQ